MLLQKDSKANTNRTNRIMEEGYTYHELHTKGEHEKYSKFQALSAHFFLFVKNEAMKKMCLKYKESSPNQEEEGTQCTPTVLTGFEVNSLVHWTKNNKLHSHFVVMFHSHPLKIQL